MRGARGASRLVSRAAFTRSLPTKPASKRLCSSKTVKRNNSGCSEAPKGGTRSSGSPSPANSLVSRQLPVLGRTLGGDNVLSGGSSPPCAAPPRAPGSAAPQLRQARSSCSRFLGEITAPRPFERRDGDGGDGGGAVSSSAASARAVSRSWGCRDGRRRAMGRSEHLAGGSARPVSSHSFSRLFNTK